MSGLALPQPADARAAATGEREAGASLRTLRLLLLCLVVMTGYAEQLEEITRQGFTLLAKPWDAANLARALRGTREFA